MHKYLSIMIAMTACVLSCTVLAVKPGDPITNRIKTPLKAASVEENWKYDYFKDTKPIRFVSNLKELDRYRGTKGVLFVRRTVWPGKEDLVDTGWKVVTWDTAYQTWRTLSYEGLENCVTTNDVLNIVAEQGYATSDDVASIQTEMTTKLDALDNHSHTNCTYEIAGATDTIDVGIYNINNIVLPEDFESASLSFNPNKDGVTTLFFDNIERNRHHLPIRVNSFDGSVVGTDVYKFYKLPLVVKFTKFKEGVGTIEGKTLDDGYKWNPVISNTTFIVTSASNSYKIEMGETGYINGSALHFLDEVSIDLAYDSGTVNLPLWTLASNYDYIKVDNFEYSTNVVPKSATLKCSGNGFERTYTLK